MHFIDTGVPPDNICIHLYLFGFHRHASESKMYLQVGKAWQIVTYIHPKEAYLKIMCAETGNHHTETREQTQAPNQQISSEMAVALEYVCINNSQNNSEY